MHIKLVLIIKLLFVSTFVSLFLCCFADYYNTSILWGKREPSINSALENYVHFEIHILSASAIKINYPT